jgi:hypothetical protein
MTAQETKTVELAMGRIFGMLQRAEQPGDVAEYERCKALIIDMVNPPPFVDHAPNFARDRHAIVMMGG